MDGRKVAMATILLQAELGVIICTADPVMILWMVELVMIPSKVALVMTH